MTVDLNPASAVSVGAPSKILFGAGMYCHDVVLNSSDSDGTAPVTSMGGCIGVTNGGGKLSIVPNIVDIGIDQSNIARKGSKVKCGETATMEPNMTELSGSLIGKTVFGDVTDKTQYDLVEPRASIADGDYVEGLAFVGQTATGKPVIVWFKTAIVTSGLEADSKKGEQSAPTLRFECVGDADQATDALPYKVIWPKYVAAAATGGVD